jgi:hypothetical protein
MINQTSNYQFAEKLVAMVMQKTDTMQGWVSCKMNKKDQLALFNHYFGKDNVVINAETEMVYHARSICLGTDYEITAQTNGQPKWYSASNELHYPVMHGGIYFSKVTLEIFFGFSGIHWKSVVVYNNKRPRNTRYETCAISQQDRV